MTMGEKYRKQDSKEKRECGQETKEEWEESKELVSIVLRLQDGVTIERTVLLQGQDKELIHITTLLSRVQTIKQ